MKKLLTVIMSLLFVATIYAEDCPLGNSDIIQKLNSIGDRLLQEQGPIQLQDFFGLFAPMLSKQFKYEVAEGSNLAIEFKKPCSQKGNEEICDFTFNGKGKFTMVADEKTSMKVERNNDKKMGGRLVFEKKGEEVIGAKIEFAKETFLAAKKKKDGTFDKGNFVKSMDLKNIETKPSVELSLYPNGCLQGICLGVAGAVGALNFPIKDKMENGELVISGKDMTKAILVNLNKMAQ